MKVETLPIDDRIKQKLIADGITELYPPQGEAVSLGLLDGKNQVVAIPTASGKTMIAILAIFSQLLRNQGKAVFLAPLRALASEKYSEFKEFADLLGLRVAISTGDVDEQSRWLAGADIIIATNEKFDSLIRHQVEWLNEIQVVVSDEVHLINDGSRGPVLEVVLSLVRRNLPECQIIALSATINNADEIAEWLEAELILSDWRPVSLKEGVWLQGEVVFADGKKQAIGRANDAHGYVSLVEDMIQQKGQVLVFANTRKSTMSTAVTLKKPVRELLSNSELGELKKLANEIRTVGEKTELRTKLADVVESGVAFHHAGLISGHRKLVENAFKERQLKAISASPTLAAGINLPARRVVIRKLTRYSDGYNQPIPVLEYRQMAGRAGRPKYDPFGEALILAKNHDERDLFLDRFVRAETELIYSKLGNEPAMRAHILSFIASEYVDDFDSAIDMLAMTFYGYQNEGSLFLIEEVVSDVFDILTEAKLITPEEPYKITPFGKRVNELYLDPLSARMIKLGLENSDKTHDDIIYLQMLSNTPDLRTYSVRKNEINLLMGIFDQYEDEWLNFGDEEQSEYGFDIFFAALKIGRVIEMWLAESSEEEINQTFNISSGDLHALLNRMEWLVHSATEISKIFGWKHHSKSLSRINERIKYGIKEDLLELVGIPHVGRVRARILYDAGYTTKTEVMNAGVNKLSKLAGIGTRLAKLLLGELSGGTEIEEEKIKTEDIPETIQSSLDDFF